jgi:hypothetical protein
MTSARAKEVLYDSETMLRLVDSELEELRDPVSPAERIHSSDLDTWVTVLQRASTEIAQVMQTLRESRQALQGVAVNELHTSTAKIQEVSTAAETAATNILDSVDRAQVMITQLDELGADDNDDAVAVRTSLRDELFSMMGALQFQDITAQQLGHVSSMLVEVEQRLLTVTELLGGMPSGIPGGIPGAGAENVGTEGAPQTALMYSESASTLDVDERQAAADALVRSRQTP